MKEFADLGDETIGRSCVTFNPVYSRLKAILEGMTMEIRTEYVAGYRTTAPPGSGRHKARVQLMDKKLGAIRGGAAVESCRI